MNEYLSAILQGSNYSLSQFSKEHITSFSQRISFRQDKKGKEIFYVDCLSRKKEIRLTPEEVVRQLFYWN